MANNYFNHQQITKAGIPPCDCAFLTSFCSSCSCPTTVSPIHS